MSDPSVTPALAEWWHSQPNLGAVAHYMAHVRGDSASTIAEVMEKPWKWPELWTELQSALDVDIDEVHLRYPDGRCVISLNGQVHMPCPVTVEQVREVLGRDSLAAGLEMTGSLKLAFERADRVAHKEAKDA